ncbi:MAG: C25 family cysteine peptidase, partial [Candidatus Cloacimonadales bacterium]
IEKANIEISFDNTPSVNEITRSSIKPVQEFEQFFASAILNYQAPDTRDDYQNPTILYIYPQAIHANPIMEGLFKWRREQGWIVHTAGTSVTGNSSTSIKAYIQNAYDNWENPPAFITIIGDADGALAVPTYNGGYDQTGDHYYGLLEGNDELEDVFLGRLSINDVTQLATVVAKTIKYEKATTVTNPAYFTRALLVADTTPSGQSTIITNQYVKEAMLAYNEDFTFTELYGDSPSASSVSNALNNGMNFWNYRGWINMDGWGSTQANALTNVNRLSISVILTCSTGTFYSGTSVTESIVRAGTSASPTGGVCSIGMATSGTHTAFNNCLNGGIMGHLFQEDGWTMGGALGRGKHHMWEAYGVSKPDKVQIHTTLCNMIGDSSLRVYKGIPKILTAQHLENVPAGTNQIKVITKENGEILPNIWVTLNVNDEYISGFTNSNGIIYMDIPFYATGQGKLTISKEGYRPAQHIMNFGLEAPNINAGNIIITQNGQVVDSLTPNASFNIQIAANNVSNSDIANVSGTISSGINGVAVIQNTATYGDIAQSASVSNNSPYQIMIANRAYENSIPINVVFSNSTYSWERRVLIPIKSPIIEVTDYAIANPNFGPGRTSLITTLLANHGNKDISFGHATLSSTDNRITVISDEATLIGAIPAGGTASITFNISASDGFLPGDLAPLTINIEDSGFETVCYFSLPIGVATITDPLGADAYGYYIFDSFDVGYDECPVYEWIELNPASGGTGTLIALPDSGANQEKVQTVDLPFDFTFYGLNYDKVSICSNGWIGLGITQQATHRNWRLPGPMGPSPMIAPFWDDLVTGGQGKVFIAHNQDEHYFVITWDKWKSAYSSSYEETFQVILYDPVYYMSSTSDAPIKIQYKVINNVNNASGNEHGEYCTVGIEDHTGTVGLEYTYNNQYPVAAKHLQNGLALYITTKIGQLPPFVIAQPDDIIFEEDHVDSSIDLYKIFKDPNNDELEFTFSESEYLSFEANEEGYLVITPIRNWFGIETVTIYASDGVTDSDASVTFLVTVTPVNDRPSLQSKFPEQTNTESATNYMYFKVNVIDVDSELIYEWKINSVVVEGEVTDSLYYVFETTDTYSVKCYISDQDFTVIASWNVDVTTDNVAETILENNLAQNIPNPFNPSTTINFSLKKSSNVSLVVYNIKGQKVKTLLSEKMQQGNHNVVWNGLDDRNRTVSSGVYFYRIATDDYQSTKKAIMMK